MYNEEIKSEFLNSGDIDKEGCIKLFHKSLETEIELSKDLCEFNVKEIISVFSKQEEFVLLSEYIDWVICQGHKKSNVNLVELVLVDDDNEEGDD